MSIKTIESQVKHQSILLAKELPNLIASSLMVGKFIAFFNGQTVIKDTHEECFKEAEKYFGSSGFVISEVTVKKLMVSSLVKF